MSIKNKHYIWLLLFVGFIVRLMAFQSDFMFTSDVHLFQFWGLQLNEHGFSQFYAQPFFCDYPPGYMYVLALSGRIASWLGLQVLSTGFNFIIFLPSMLADLAIGFIVFRVVAYGRLFGKKGEEKQSASKDLPINITTRALIMSALWVFNPAIILISSVWGQIESVFVLFLLISLLLLREKRIFPAYILFGLAILIKAQSLFLGPVYLYSAYTYLMDNRIPGDLGKSKIDPKAIGRLIVAIGSAVLLMFVLMIPFTHNVNFDFRPLIELYTGAIETYPRASVNAFNFWGLLGRNWAMLYDNFLFMSHSSWGILIVVAIIVAAIAALHRDHTKYEGRHFMFIVGALFMLIYVFSVRMHERYMFPALMFFLLYYAETGEKRSLGMYAAASTVFFANCVEVLRQLHNFPIYGTWDLQARAIPIVSLGAVSIGGVLLYMLIKHEWMAKESPSAGGASKVKAKAKPRPTPRTKTEQEAIDPPPMTVRDYGFIFALIIVYSFIAFFRLGDTQAPQTSWAPEFNGTATIDFGEVRQFDGLQFHIETDRDHIRLNDSPFFIFISNDGYHWEDAGVFPAYWETADITFDDWGNPQATPSWQSHYVRWSDVDISFEAKYAEIRLHANHIVVQELAFLSAEDEPFLWTPEMGDTAVIDFGEVRQVERFQHRLGAASGMPFTVSTSNDGHNWEFLQVFYPYHTEVFHWVAAYPSFEARYVQLRTDGHGLRIQEVAFRDGAGELIPIAGVSPGGEALVDEQHLVPIQRRFMNSTYFDEIYHPRSGYEKLHGLEIFEWTHPPMGKNFIAMSISAFGMTPFGWRFPGTLVGVLMVPLIYAFARFLLKSNNWALFAAAIFTFDFMHFAQTRLATIDSYVTFFVMGMYFLMYLFVHGIDKDSFRRKMIILGLCGVCLGLAIASKWQGLYAAVGLPFLFFPALYRLYLRDKKQATTIFYSCFGFFVGLPIVIYLLAYIPFVNSSTAGHGFLRTVWNNQVAMYNYHAHTVAESTHAFSSYWWEWPLNLRPLWLYLGHFTAEGMRSTISTFGNPAVFWGGAVAMFIAAYYFITRKRDKDLIFLFIAFAAQFLPWVIAPRSLTWIYHFFPSVPFMVLIMAWVFKNYVKKPQIAIGYTVVVVGLFALFYPVLSGLPVSQNFIDTYLQWLPRWQF